MIANAVRLVAGWGTVAAFLIYGPAMIGQLGAPFVGIVLFTWLLAVMIWAASGVVHEAEELAAILGEPYGTLILTFAVVGIEVTLISVLMFDANASPTLGRDTMFAVLMIVMNGVVGLGLLIGGLRHYEQEFNLRGAGAYLRSLTPLSLIALVLPNFTASTPDGSLTAAQAICFSIFTVLVYGVFLALQTGRHRGFFVEQSERGAVAVVADAPAAAPRRRSLGAIAGHVALLLANILPIVILSKSLGVVMDFGMIRRGVPPALSGVLIAMVVFMPEGTAAVRAITANAMQRAINLCLGSALSTLGLTVPAILIIGLITGQSVVLGVSPTNMVLLAMTLVLNQVTYSGPSMTMLEGAVHLSIFFVFIVLIFSP